MANQIQFSLFTPVLTQSEINFIRVCNQIARKCGLHKVSQEEIEKRCKRIEGEYQKLLKEVDRR